MTKHTEKEINDAIAVVMQALRDYRIQVEISNGWSTAGYVEYSGTHKYKYRAKPDPVEFWVHEHCLYRNGRPEKDKTGWIKVREVTDE